MKKRKYEQLNLGADGIRHGLLSGGKTSYDPVWRLHIAFIVSASSAQKESLWIAITRCLQATSSSFPT